MLESELSEVVLVTLVTTVEETRAAVEVQRLALTGYEVIHTVHEPSFSSGIGR